MADINVGIKSVAAISLYDKTAGAALVLQTTKAVTFSPGITQRVEYASNELGVEVPVRQVVDREDPTIKIVYPKKNLDALAQGLNRKWVKAGATTAVDTNWVRQFTPTKGDYPAVLAGIEGFGVAQDPVGAVGSVLLDGVSEPMTIQPYATFVPATPKSFAIGLNGALKFSTDVIGSSVLIDVPNPILGIYYLGEKPFSNLSMRVSLIMDDFKMIQLRFPSAAISQDNTSINFAEGGVEATYRSIFDGSRCVAYDMVYLGTARTC
jgi:hypothetical protein